MSDNIEPGAVVVPLDDGSPAEQSDPWRMLAQGTGILVSWQKPPDAVGQSWGGALRATSALSQQLGSIMAIASTSTSVRA